MDKSNMEHWEGIRIRGETAEGLDEQECRSEWNGESEMSLESGVGDRNREEEEAERARWAKKMEEQEKYEKEMEEMVRSKKKKAEEEKARREKNRERREEQQEEEEVRRREEVGNDRQEDVRRGEGSFEEKVERIQKGLRDIASAVSREDSKSKLSFGRMEQQTVKNTVIGLLDGLVDLTVGQMRAEGRARDWEERYLKLEAEKNRMSVEWERKQEEMKKEIERLERALRAFYRAL